MQSKREKKQWTFTGWHMLIITVSFFAVIFGMNLFMAISAKNSWTGLVVKNTYVASQEYNSKLATSRLQHEQGWNSSVSYNDKIITFSLLSKDGSTIEATEVLMQVNRVVGVEGELLLSLSKNENGLYSAPAELASGIWNVSINATLPDETKFEHYYQIKIED